MTTNNVAGRSSTVAVTVMLFLFAAVPLAAGLGVTWWRARALVEENAHALLAARADELVGALDTRNHDALIFARLLANHPDISAYVDGVKDDAAVSAVFDRARAAYPAVISVAIIDKDGRVVASNIAEAVGRDMKNRPHIQRVLAGEAGVGDVRLSQVVPGAPEIVTYAAPIGDPARGAFVVAIAAESLWAPLRLSNDRAGARSYSVVVDEFGIRIAHSFRADHIFHPTAPLDAAVVDAAAATGRFGPRTRELLTQVIAEPDEHARAVAAVVDDHVYRYVGDANDAATLSVGRRCSTVPWTVFFQVPEESVYQPLASLWRGSVGVGLLLSLLGSVMAYLVARRTVRRFREMGAFARALARGDRSARLSGFEKEAPEVLVILTELNNMADAITREQATLEARVDERTQALQGANAELAAQAEELGAQKRELARKNDAVERADRMKSEFLANMSHELRTPLNSIIGFTDLVLTDEDLVVDDKHRVWLTEVSGSARHLLNLINEILDLSKIESGHIQLDKRPVSVADVIAGAVETIRVQGRKKSLDVSVKAVDAAVVADVARLRQILLNLLSNAVKMSPHGGAIVVRADDEGAFVKVSVDDQGPGVAADLLPRLFAPFVQGESVLTKSQQGTGLGLVICKKLVELHGGDIGVERASRGGARFWFTVPKANGDASTPTVLLIAAHDRRDVLRGYLASGGYVCAYPDDDEDAVNAVARTAPDAVVVDLIGSGEAAHVVVDAVRRADPDVALVVFGAGARGFVPKPIESTRLLAELSRTLAPPARLLSIDDDPRVGDLLRELLRPAGYEVESVQRPDEGLERARANPPDAILVDLVMPGLSGFEVIEALSAAVRTRHIPVVVFTARDLTAQESSWLQGRARAVAREGQRHGRRAARLGGPRGAADSVNTADARPDANAHAEGGARRRRPRAEPQAARRVSG